MTITAKQIDDTTYYKAVVRGVEYCAYLTKHSGWCVITRRIALGRSNPGGCKYFDSLSELSAKVKAFSGLDALLSV